MISTDILRPLCLLIVSLLLLSSSALSDSPTAMNYQGLLNDAAGDPVADGNYSLTFTIYDASVGGNSKWAETKSVSTANGLFSVLLGTTNPIIDTVFSGTTRYLGIQIATDDELSPRIPLVSVPYAFWSSRSDLATSAGQAAFADSAGALTDGSIDLSDIGQNGASTNQIMKWNGSAWTTADDATGGTGWNWSDSSSHGPDSVLYADTSSYATAAGSATTASSATMSDSTASITDGGVDLSDIGQNGATNGQIMKWNGSTWTTADDATGGTGWNWSDSSSRGPDSVLYADTSDYATSASSASSAAVSDSAGAMADGGIDLADIGQNGATNNQILKWNGSAWTTADDATGDSGWNWSDSSSHGPDSVLYADTSSYATAAGSATTADSATTANSAAMSDSTAAITDGGIDLADIGQNGATNGQIMKWNGSAWTLGSDNGSGGGWTFSGNLMNLTDPDDSVGVGTSTPKAKLGVSITSSGDTTVAVRGRASGGTSNFGLYGIAGDTSGLGYNVGVYAIADDGDEAIGLYAKATGSNKVAAALLDGNVGVMGNLYVAGDIQNEVGALSDGTVLFEDVGTNSATSGQVMKYNGSSWTAADDDTGSDWNWSDSSSYGPDSVSYSANSANASSATRSDSTDAITDGGIDLADIGQNGATTDQILKWNGSAWAVAEDDGGTPSGWMDVGKKVQLEDFTDSVGIGVVASSAKLQVAATEGTSTWAIYGTASGTGDNTALTGYSAGGSSNKGIYGQGDGGTDHSYGVHGSSSNNDGMAYGIRGQALQTGTNIAYGGDFYSSAAGNKSYGIFTHGNAQNTDTAFGTFSTGENTSTGTAIGGYFTASGATANEQIGLVSKLSSGDANELYGLKVDLVKTGTAARVQGIQCLITNETSEHTSGVIINCNSNGGSGSQTGLVATTFTSGGDAIGVSAHSQNWDVNGISRAGIFEAYGDGYVTGLVAKGISGGAEATYGIFAQSSNTGIGTEYAGYFTTSANSSGTHYGIYVDAKGSGSEVLGIRSDATNDDGLTQAGFFTALNTSSQAARGLYSIAINSGSGKAIGVLGTAVSYGTGEHYGIYGMEAIGGTGAAVYASGDFVASGTKSAVVRTSQGEKLYYAVESPEVWFEDFGSGQLSNGQTRINLDPLFLESIGITDDQPLKVFIQLNGDCNGTYVTTDNTGFDVHELQNGNSNAAFTWRAIAKRKGYETERLRSTTVGNMDVNLYPERAEEIQKMFEVETDKVEHSAPMTGQQ